MDLIAKLEFDGPLIVVMYEMTAGMRLKHIATAATRRARRGTLRRGGSARNRGRPRMEAVAWTLKLSGSLTGAGAWTKPSRQSRWRLLALVVSYSGFTVG